MQFTIQLIEAKWYYYAETHFVCEYLSWLTPLVGIDIKYK